MTSLFSCSHYWSEWEIPRLSLNRWWTRNSTPGFSRRMSPIDLFTRFLFNTPAVCTVTVHYSRSLFVSTVRNQTLEFKDPGWFPTAVSDFRLHLRRLTSKVSSQLLHWASSTCPQRLVRGGDPKCLETTVRPSTYEKMLKYMQQHSIQILLRKCSYKQC